jgi:hypothetical protein
VKRRHPTELVLRPDGRGSQGRRHGPGVGLGILGTLAGVFLFWRLGFLALGIAVVAIGWLGAAAMAVYWGRTRLRLADGRLFFRSGFGRERSWPVGDIGHALLIGGTLRMLGRDGTLWFTCDRTMWSEDELRELCRSVTGDITDVPSMPIEEQARRYPGSITWAMRHPQTLQLIVVVPAILLFAGFGVLVFGGPWR